MLRVFMLLNEVCFVELFGGNGKERFVICVICFFNFCFLEWGFVCLGFPSFFL